MSALIGDKFGHSEVRIFASNENQPATFRSKTGIKERTTGHC